MSPGHPVAKASKAVWVKVVAMAAAVAGAARRALKVRAARGRDKVAVKAAVRAGRMLRGRVALLAAINADPAAVASVVGRVAVIVAGRVEAGRVEAEIVVRVGSVANADPAAIRAARRPVQRRAAQRRLAAVAVDSAVRGGSLRARKVAVMAAAVRAADSKAKVAGAAAGDRRAEAIRIDPRSSTR